MCVHVCTVGYVHLRGAPFTVNAAPHKQLSFTCMDHLKLYVYICCYSELLIMFTWEQCAPFYQIYKVNPL